MNLFEIADRFPPNICRLVARVKSGRMHRPKTDREIAQDSGLSRSYVGHLALRRTWKGIPIDVVVRFSTACGVNLKRPGRTRQFLRKGKRAYLRTATFKQRVKMGKLLNTDHPRPVH